MSRLRRTDHKRRGGRGSSVNTPFWYEYWYLLNANQANNLQNNYMALLDRDGAKISEEVQSLIYGRLSRFRAAVQCDWGEWVEEHIPGWREELRVASQLLGPPGQSMDKSSATAPPTSASSLPLAPPTPKPQSAPDPPGHSSAGPEIREIPGPQRDRKSTETVKTPDDGESEEEESVHHVRDTIRRPRGVSGETSDEGENEEEDRTQDVRGVTSRARRVIKSVAIISTSEEDEDKEDDRTHDVPDDLPARMTLKEWNALKESKRMKEWSMAQKAALLNQVRYYYANGWLADEFSVHTLCQRGLLLCSEHQVGEREMPPLRRSKAGLLSCRRSGEGPSSAG